MSTKIIGGEVLCPFCPGPPIELGRDTNGETVTIPTALRRIVGRGQMNTLRLECGHCVYKLPPLLSAQEHVEFEDGSVLANGHLPVGAA